MRRLMLWGLLLLPAPLALAAKAPPPAERPTADAAQECKELEAEYRVAMNDFRKACREVEREDGARALAEYEKQWDPTPGFVERFEAKAKEYAGSEDAVQFLGWIVVNATGDGKGPLPKSADKALRTLTKAHGEHKAFLAFVAGLGRELRSLGKERCVATLDHVVDHAEDQLLLQALFARGSLLLEAPETTQAEDKQARADLEKVMKLDAGGSYGQRADAYLFEFDNLRIGKVAPDIEGKDLDGVAFKLSDYRGKVVVLDFWGDW